MYLVHTMCQEAVGCGASYWHAREIVLADLVGRALSHKSAYPKSGHRLHKLETWNRRCFCVDLLTQNARAAVNEREH